MTSSPSLAVVLLDRHGTGDAHRQSWEDACAAYSGPTSVTFIGDERSDQWWVDTPRALGLGADDLVVIVEADATPGPHLLERLVGSRGRDATVVTARLLPVEPAPVACALLTVGALERLGSDWPASLGADHRVEHTAMVCLRVRFDEPSGMNPLSTADTVGRERSPGTGDVHPADQPATSLHAVLARAGVSWTAPRRDAAADRPFLTVVTRTQGTRGLCLEDMFTCLAAQTDRDFEMLLACHRTDVAGMARTRAIVASLPSWLAERVEVMEVTRPGRSAPLNDAFAAARGRYVSILDDDDTVFPHWVQTFHEAESRAAGRVLRAVALRQDVVPLEGVADVCAVPLGEPVRDWPWTFELVDHLRANYSPCMTVAFPRGVFHDLGIRFDETLATTEDWDFLVRAAGLVGVESAPELTSVYRWWVGQHSSRDLHDKEEWDEGHQRVVDGFDDDALVLPAGSVRRLREVIDEGWDQAHELATSQHQVILDLNTTASAHDHAVELWHAAEERATAAREKLVKRTQRFDERLGLMGEADALLRQTGTDPERPVFDLSAKELRELIALLKDRPARRGRWPRR